MENILLLSAFADIKETISDLNFEWQKVIKIQLALYVVSHRVIHKFQLQTHIK
jgi:hypothetical protein